MTNERDNISFKNKGVNSAEAKQQPTMVESNEFHNISLLEWTGVTAMGFSSTWCIGALQISVKGSG